MICVKCKKEIPDGSIYCNYCGRKQTIAPKTKTRRPRGTGTVFKTSDHHRNKPWCARYYNILVGYFETKAEAASALQKVVDTPVSDYYNYTVAQMYDLWKKDHFKDLKPKGIEQYETAYKKIASLYNRKFRSLHLDDMQTIIDEMEAAGKSESSRAKVKHLFSQLYQRAMVDHIVPQNDAKFIRIRPLEENESDQMLLKEKPIFSADDIAVLKAHDEDDTVKLILILIYSGMRIGELMTLKKANVNLDVGYMVGGSKTKKGKNRLIPIHPAIADYVHYFFHLADGELLVSGYKGNKIQRNFREREFYPTLIRLGINRKPTGDPATDAIIESEKKKPHAARRTFATLAVRSGIKPEHLQKIIGHAQYDTTLKYYAQMSKDDLIQSMLDIDDTEND